MTPPMAEQQQPRRLIDVHSEDLPLELRVPQTVHAALESRIQEGMDLNAAQVAFIVACVRYCSQHKIVANLAYAAVALNALQSREELPTFDQGLLAVLEKRNEIRALAERITALRQEKEQLAMSPTSADRDEQPKGTSRSPHLYVSEAKQAIQGGNPEHAAFVMEDAAIAYPRFPEIRYFAGFCAMLAAAKDHELDLFTRIKLLKGAIEHFTECAKLAQNPKIPSFAKWYAPAGQQLTRASHELLTLSKLHEQQEIEFNRQEETQKQQEKRRTRDHKKKYPL